MFCFSKGLGAPVGSVLCGRAALITAARTVRRRFGGDDAPGRGAGRRRPGGAARLGAPGRGPCPGPPTWPPCLEERLPGAVVAPPQTNMVQVAGERLPGGPEPFREALAAAGVRVGYIRPGVLRFVTHRDVDGGRRGPGRRRGRSPGPVTPGAAGRRRAVTFALLFPGQGSQAVGMGADVFAARPDLAATAARRPGLGPGAPLPGGPRGGAHPHRARPAGPVHRRPSPCGRRWRRGWAGPRPGPPGTPWGSTPPWRRPGAFSFEDGPAPGGGAGPAMAAAAAAAPSGMAALLGADCEAAEALAAARRAEGGSLWVANVNAPGQVVVAGGHARPGLGGGARPASTGCAGWCRSRWPGPSIPRSWHRPRPTWRRRWRTPPSGRCASRCGPTPPRRSSRGRPGAAAAAPAHRPGALRRVAGGHGRRRHPPFRARRPRGRNRRAGPEVGRGCRDPSWCPASTRWTPWRRRSTPPPEPPRQEEPCRPR